MVAKFVFDAAAFAEEYADEVDAGTVCTVVPMVRSRVSSQPTSRTAYLAKPAEKWDWKDLRDYVVDKVLQMHPGLLPKRNEAKEFGIFSAFAGRWGEQAGPIAVFAFETQPQCGMWMNAPIGIQRFCKASDQYFAQVIVDEHLNQS